MTEQDPWPSLLEDPEFMEGMQQAQEDIEAGRLYRGRFVWSKLPEPPLDSWKPDDPVQPDGWYHDGKKWRLRRDGTWFADPWGYWRYNYPGDIGWVQERPGDEHCGWHYVKGGALDAEATA